MKRAILVLISAIVLVGCATEVKTAAPNADLRAKALRVPKERLSST